MPVKTLSLEKQAAALRIVAAWLGPKMGYEGTAPTGPGAARHALGPDLVPDWDWPHDGPTPTILLEGGPYDWAVEASMNDTVVDQLAEVGVFAEPFAGYALCLYVKDWE